MAHVEQKQNRSVRQRFELNGRNYIVTGGGQGIGFAVAEAICEMGGNVGVLDLRQTPVGEFDTLAERFGVKTAYAQTDVSSAESLQAGLSRFFCGSFTKPTTNAQVVFPQRRKRSPEPTPRSPISEECRMR